MASYGGRECSKGNKPERVKQKALLNKHTTTLVCRPNKYMSLCKRLLVLFKTWGFFKIMKQNMQESLAFTTSDDWDDFVKKLKGVLLTF